MKKRVRVYKAGGQSNQPTQQQIEAYLAQEMSADTYDGDVDTLKDNLISAGIDEDIADEYITSVSDDLGLNQDTLSVEEQQLAAEEQARAQEEEQALLEEQELAAEKARQKQLAAMYDTDIDMSTTEDTSEDEELLYSKNGGSKLSKRSFIKEYTKFAKMARGGDTPNPGPDDVLNGREEHVNGFLDAVKNTANDAVLRQEAEAQYGRYQNGGAQKDNENLMHHLGAYATGLHDIFSQNQNIQNDAPHGQFGGFTDTDSGLYKFIGGGDNESADEMYQDSDIDFNQEEFQMGGFRMPKRSGRQYTQAVGSPYYTETGEAAVNPNLAGRQVTSVDVTKRGLLGRPKAYTVNYGNPNATVGTTPQIKMPTEDEAKALDAKYAAQDKKGNRQPVADWMMRSGIPGIKQMGARMTRSGVIPEVPQGSQPTTPAATQAGNTPYYPPMDARAQRRERRDDAKLNRFLGNKDADVFNDPKEVARIQSKIPGYKPFGDTDKAKEIANQASSLINPSATTKTPIPVGGFVDQSVVASLNAYPKEQQAQIADIKLQNKAANDDMLNGVSRKAMNYDYGSDKSAQEFQRKYPSFAGQRSDEFWGQQQPAGTIQYSPEKAQKMRAMGLNPDTYGHHYLFENPDKFKEYGGPIDYTEYAYGGDVSVPELYRAQDGTQVSFDPNKNNMNISNLQGYFDKAPTKNVAGEQIDATVPENMQPNNQLSTDTPDNYSQDFELKRDWDKTRDNINAGMMVVNAGLDIADQVKARKQENQMLANTTSAESNYGISNQDNRGDYDPNSGLFRPDQMGFTGVARYGGVYATGGSLEDEDEDIVYMTQEEIDNFMANGGELEYL